MPSIFSNIKIKRFLPLSISLAVVACMASLVIPSSEKFLIWNTTSSMPKGLYCLSHADIIRRGDIVYFPIPIEVKNLVVNERKWLGKDCCLMKKVAAVEDDFVCINGSSLRIKDVTGFISSLDSLGRPLPSISYCGLLKKGELFVGDITNPKSFDSRYFGPIDIDQVMGVARPIWTF